MAPSSTEPPTPIRPAGSTPFSVGTVVLGGGACLLMVFLAVGFLLPSDWVARAELVVGAPPEALIGYLDSPEGWREWTDWPDSGLVRSGPERGAGASLAWDDAEVGNGSFTITESSALGFVRYGVEFGSSMRASGEVVLTQEPTGTRVEWREEGDLGRNPLMGYWALFMGRGQAEEMAKGLERLARVTYSP